MRKTIVTILILFFSASIFAENSFSQPHNSSPYNEEKTMAHLNAEQAYVLGDKYLNSIGVSMDIPKAFHLFEIAAKNGHPKAQFELGKMYEFWDWWHNIQPPSLLDKIKFFLNSWNKTWYLQKSFQWYLKSAHQGYYEAISEVGISYYEGRGIPINIKEAYYWFLLGAQQHEYRSLSYLKNINNDLTKFQIEEIKKRIKK